MQSEAKIQFFLGANAPTGFCSLYGDLLAPAGARTIYILKGGPGCGKSSLMRRVAAAMEERGLTVERILCSGDPDSLDAVVIPELAAALVDGTSPHVVEPVYPGLVETYVNLGACYDRAGLQASRQELMGAMTGYKDHYRRAYRCLSAADQIQRDMRAVLMTQELEEKLRKRTKGILAREIRKGKGEGGKVVRRFLGGITWQGEIRLFDTAEYLCKRIYELSDTYGVAHGMLAQLAAGATAAGHDVIVCPAPTDPERMEHLLIPGLSLAFVSSSPAMPFPHRPYRRIRLDAMADQEVLRRDRARFRFSRKVAAALTEEAVQSLAQAKAMHAGLEQLYNPHVDFEQVYRIADGIIEELTAGM